MSEFGQAVSDTGTITWRNLTRLRRQPDSIFFGIVQSVMFVLLFAFVFGGAIVVPGGEFTSELSRLRSGDELLVEKQATGFLTLDRFPDGRDLWLIGTGTGLAPFLSILQDLEAWQRFERIVLVYSARDRGELAYQELIAELPQREWLEGAGHKLQYIPLVTREQVPGALHARVTTLIENGELERAAGLALEPEHSRIMLCGNPQMIEDTRAALKARNLNLALTRRPGQVAVENYW